MFAIALPQFWGKSFPMDKRAERLEADLLAEEISGKPVNHGSNAAAILSLEERLTMLTLRRQASQLQDNSHLDRDIAEARQQLATYRRLEAGRN